MEVVAPEERVAIIKSFVVDFRPFCMSWRLGELSSPIMFDDWVMTRLRFTFVLPFGCLYFTMIGSFSAAVPGKSLILSFYSLAPVKAN